MFGRSFGESAQAEFQNASLFLLTGEVNFQESNKLENFALYNTEGNHSAGKSCGNIAAGGPGRLRTFQG